MSCSVGNCGRPVKTRGWCQAHYMRWWTTGDVQAEKPLKPYSRDVGERLWRQVDRRDPDECWPFTGPTTKGYGYVKGAGLAHRLAYRLMVGPIESGRQLDHLCHTQDRSCRGGPTCLHRRCVNPSHLEPVTPRENSQRGRAGDRVRERAARITHCPRGHEYAVTGFYLAANGTSRVCKVCASDRQRAKSLKGQGVPDPRRLSDELVRQVRELLAAGKSHSQIAAVTGVSAASVSRIRNSGSWFAPE